MLLVVKDELCLKGKYFSLVKQIQCASKNLNAIYVQECKVTLFITFNWTIQHTTEFQVVLNACKHYHLLILFKNVWFFWINRYCNFKKIVDNGFDLQSLLFLLYIEYKAITFLMPFLCGIAMNTIIYFVDNAVCKLLGRTHFKHCI